MMMLQKQTAIGYLVLWHNPLTIKGSSIANLHEHGFCSKEFRKMWYLGLTIYDSYDGAKQVTHHMIQQIIV